MCECVCVCSICYDAVVIRVLNSVPPPSCTFQSPYPWQLMTFTTIELLTWKSSIEIRIIPIACLYTYMCLYITLLVICMHVHIYMCMQGACAVHVYIHTDIFDHSNYVDYVYN